MVAVTKLISLLDKPALVYWANKIGLKGESLCDNRKKTTSKGTKKHELVECFIKKGELFDGVDLFLECIKEFEVLSCEENVGNGFLVGRIDLLLKKNGLKYVVDMKSSSKIYLSTKLQLSAYKHMINADMIAVIDLNNFKMTTLNIDTVKYYEIIKRLYQINELLKTLKEKL